jgi:hypothetical protein
MKHYTRHSLDTGTEIDYEPRKIERRYKQGAVLMWILIVCPSFCFGMLGMIIYQLVSK